MVSGDDKLSTSRHWSKRWESEGKTDISFDPYSPMFRDLHALFEKHLPREEGLKFLEIGCYPGTYMWYFSRFFGYKVSGIEYVDWCSHKTGNLLADKGIKSEIINADFFEYSPLPESRWDVVASFGFIEHFKNTEEVIQRHVDLVKTGGYLVLVIPNHQGVYGRILKSVSPEKHKLHNLMSYEDVRNALNNLGNMQIIEGGYYGRLGFWNTGIYASARTKGRLPYLIMKTPLWLLEHTGRLLPNSSCLSPNIAVIARKIR